MKLTIFFRLALGYFAVILVTGSVSAYSVFNLDKLYEEAKGIVTIDERILDLKTKLSNTILSQLGHQKKFILTADSVFYSQFLSAEKDFSVGLKQATALADTPTKREILGQISVLEKQLSAIMYGEIEAKRADPNYPKEEYDTKKDDLVGKILDNLKLLADTSMKDAYERMHTMGLAADSARKMALYMFAVAIVLIIGISYMSTRSIIKPLRTVSAKTNEISQGIFEGNLAITSPPEIAELGRAVNAMCQKLKEVDIMKADFFSAMSHELRTPLTSIKQGVSLLRSGYVTPISAKQERLLDILAQETHRLIEMVNSLLDLSKMEAGMMTYDFHETNLVSLIRQVTTEMAPLLETKKLTTHVECDESTPLLRLDRERILQAIRNLVGNAVKFSPDGGHIDIACSRKEHSIEFSIKDTGPGIPKENLGTIFEKFQQLSANTPKWGKGTGLGLSLVKHIIVAHGGRVWAESQLGQGCTFIFALPLS